MSAPTNVEKEPGPVVEETPAVATPASEVVPEKRKREYKDFGHEQEKATHANVDMSTVCPPPPSASRGGTSF